MDLRDFLTDFRDELPEANIPITSHEDIGRLKSMTLTAESEMMAAWRVLDKMSIQGPFKLHFKSALSSLSTIEYVSSTSQCKESVDILIQLLTSIYVDLSGAAISSGVIQKVVSENAPEYKLFHPLNLLSLFACLCDRENRQIIECIIGDLKKVIRKMQREKYADNAIKWVLRWQVAKSITRITWDGFRRFLAAVFPVGTIIRKLIGL